MIISNSMLNVADNSGVRLIKCIMIERRSGKGFAGVGTVVIASARKVIPTSKIRKGTVVKAVIVRTKKALVRPDGSKISFSDNAAVIINEQREPVGTRIFGPVTRELKQKNFVKITSLAHEVL